MDHGGSLRRFGARVLLIAAALLLAPVPASQAGPDLSAPVPVTLPGYDGDAMEPFLSRDGRVLLFNNRNAPPDRTDLRWARRIDDTTFRYAGLVEGANSPALDGVPTLSADGRLCFISVRAYRETLGTVFCADWRDGSSGPPQLQADASPRIPGRLVFDLELAADGRTAVLADGRFTGGPVPAAADLRLARMTGGRLALSPADDRLFAAVNTPALEYAPALSPDGLTLAFTRMTGPGLFASAAIYLARRPSAEAPFGPPERIRAIPGFAEAPTFSPDGRWIYFHRRIGGRFSIWRVATPSP